MTNKDHSLAEALQLKSFLLAMTMTYECLRAISLSTSASLATLDQARSNFNDLEVLVVALVRNGGHSWADIGAQKGVARQTIHRRLSGSTDIVVDEMQRHLREAAHLGVLREECQKSADRLRRILDELESPDAEEDETRRTKTNQASSDYKSGQAWGPK